MPLGKVRHNDGLYWIRTKKRHTAIAKFRDCDNIFVIRIQNSSAGWEHDINLRTINFDELLGIFKVMVCDIFTLHVFGKDDIRDDTDFATIIGQAVEQDFKTIILNDCSLDLAIEQQTSGIVPIGAITRLECTFSN